MNHTSFNEICSTTISWEDTSNKYIKTQQSRIMRQYADGLHISTLHIINNIKHSSVEPAITGRFYSCSDVLINTNINKLSNILVSLERIDSLQQYNDYDHRRYSHYIDDYYMYEIWISHGKIHRNDGPAISIWKSRKKIMSIHVINGVIHRTDGPAFFSTWNFRLHNLPGLTMSEQSSIRNTQDKKKFVDMYIYYYQGKIHRTGESAVLNTVRDNAGSEFLFGVRVNMGSVPHTNKFSCIKKLDFMGIPK